MNHAPTDAVSADAAPDGETAADAWLRSLEEDRTPAAPSWFEREIAPRYPGWRRSDPLSYVDWTLDQASPRLSQWFVEGVEIALDQRDFAFALHGEQRLRFERAFNFDLGRTMRRDLTQVASRSIIDTRWRMKEIAVARVQGIEALAWRDRRRADAITPERDIWDLWEGSADLNQWDDYYFPFVLRGGRFRLELGDERLVGSDDFDQIPRTFDGVQALFLSPPEWAPGRPNGIFDGRVFYAFPVAVDYRNANQPVNDVDLFGAFVAFYDLLRAPESAALWRRMVAGARWEFHFLWQRDKDRPLYGEDGRRGDMDQYTYAGNLRLPLGPPGLEGEAFFAFQDGNYASDDIRGRAWALALALDTRRWGEASGFGLRASDREGDAPAEPSSAPHSPGGSPSHPTLKPEERAVAGPDFRPVLRASWDFASGDSDPRDGHRGTFDQIHGANHARFGLADVTGFQNLRHFGLTAAFHPDDEIDATAGYHLLWQDTDHDGLYATTGAPLRTNLSSRGARNIGTVWDAVATWRYLEHVTFEAGAAYFYPAFTASATDRHRRRLRFFYTSMTLAF